MPTKLARVRRNAQGLKRASGYVEDERAFLAFLNDGRYEIEGRTIDAAASAEIGRIRGFALDLVSLFLREAAYPRGVPFHVVFPEPSPEATEDWKLVVACLRLFFYGVLEEPRYEGYRLLGRCQRQSCRRWFMENRANQVYCTEACRLRSEAEQTRGRVRRLRSRRAAGM
jgi:hypothetical protein